MNEEEIQPIIAALESNGVKKVNKKLLEILLESHRPRWAFVKYMATEMKILDEEDAIYAPPLIGDLVKIYGDDYYALEGRLISISEEEVTIRDDAGVKTIHRCKISFIAIEERNSEIRRLLQYAIQNIEEPEEEEE